MALTLAAGRLTFVVDPTGAVDVTPVPASQVYRLQLHAGVLTVTVNETVTALISDE